MEQIDESNAAEIAEDVRDYLAEALFKLRYRMPDKAFNVLQDVIFYTIRSEAMR